jgi:hypothetical protein
MLLPSNASAGCLFGIFAPLISFFRELAAAFMLPPPKICDNADGVFHSLTRSTSNGIPPFFLAQSTLAIDFRAVANGCTEEAGKCPRPIGCQAGQSRQ